MEKDNVKYNAYVQILKEELLPAMGCTEPIALAYGAALARKVLGELPDQMCIRDSNSPSSSIPGVSIIITGPRGRSSMALYTGSVVVPFTSDTTARSWPVTALSTLDFPAFLLPKNPIWTRSDEGVSFIPICIFSSCPCSVSFPNTKRIRQNRRIPIKPLRCTRFPSQPCFRSVNTYSLPSVCGPLDWGYPRGLLCCKGYLSVQKPVCSILLHIPAGCQSPDIKQPALSARGRGPIGAPIRPRSQTCLLYTSRCV